VDFEAKARELLAALPYQVYAPGEAEVATLADALRAAALDEDARREARVALQALLEEVKARAMNQPRPVTAPPDLGAMADAHGATPVNWGDPPVSTPVADVEAVAQAAQTHGIRFDGRTHEQVFLDAITLFREGDAALGRLLWILGLSEGERRFVAALAEDASDTVTAEVYADWLEEQGRTAEGATVRRLVPRDGDVLVITAPSGASDAASRRRWAAHAADLRAKLLASGRDARVLVLPHGSVAEDLDVGAMRAAGWVRAEDMRSAAARVGADCETHPHPRFREGAGNALARVLVALGDAP
jgi:uncharacterized protein (TIGR02996 family)